MKSLVALVFLMSSTALACPQLQGNWECHSTDGTQSKTTVTQDKTAHGAIYHLTEAGGESYDIHADGVVRPIHEDGNEGTAVVRCVGDRVQGHQEFTNKELSMSGVVDFEYSLQNANALVGITKSSIAFQGQAPTLSENTTNCIRR